MEEYTFRKRNGRTERSYADEVEVVKPEIFGVPCKVTGCLNTAIDNGICEDCLRIGVTRRKCAIPSCDHELIVTRDMPPIACDKHPKI